MVVGVSYWEAINYTQEGINYYFLFWRAILLKKKLCKFRRRGFIIVSKIQRDDYQTSESVKTLAMRILRRLIPLNVYLYENL